jgi:hypothetical protein
MSLLGLAPRCDFLRARESARTRARAQSLREYRVTSCKFRILEKVLQSCTYRTSGRIFVGFVISSEFVFERTGMSGPMRKPRL